MGHTEIAAAHEIKQQVQKVVKVAKKFNFQELAVKVDELEKLIGKSNYLEGANPTIDADAIEYPFNRQSAYLRGDKPEAVVVKIENAAPEYSCGCDPARCLCSSSAESISQIKGLRCHFCDEEILFGGTLHVSETTGVKMCSICARILWEKVRLKESVAYAVINLLEDAASEADDPYFQFKESLKLVEEAKQRLKEFRLVQQGKVSR